MEKKRCKVIMLPTNEPTLIVKFKMFGKDKINYSKVILPIQDEEMYQHLYITSDDKIEEGDWYIDDVNTVRQSVTDDVDYWKARPEYKKVIATTDPELYYTQQNGHLGQAIIQISQIPQAFIEEYCRKGGIDQVDVEYEVTPSLKIRDNYNIGGEVREVIDVWLGTNDTWYVSTPNNHVWSCPIELKPKVNSDNTIIIHPIKLTGEDIITQMGWSYENTESSARRVAEYCAKIISHPVKDNWSREEVEQLCNNAMVQMSDWKNENITTHNLNILMSKWIKENL